MSKFVEVDCFAYKRNNDSGFIVNEQEPYPVLLNLDFVISVEELIGSCEGSCITCTNGQYFTHTKYEDISL